MPAMTPLAEHFGALAELRQAGLIRHLGVSGVTPGQLAEARAIAPVACVQNRYFIGASAGEHEFADACGKQGIAFVPFFTIAGEGRGTGATGTEHQEVLASPWRTALPPPRSGWPGRYCRGPHMLAIPGTGDSAHLAANVAAVALRLTVGEVTRLTSLRKSPGTEG